jgi:pimeloyl-ACP methyl ester carboxylesterase
MQKQFQYHNSTIHYNTYGQGKAVILIHGFAEDNSIWREQVNYLQQHCLVITPDLPGSGNSNLLKGVNTTIEDYARVIDAMLLNENIESCIMVGHSMGGYVTLAFAELYPQKLVGFGFVNSTAFADSEEKKETRQKGIAFIKEHGVATFLKNTTANLFSAKTKIERPELVTQLIEKGSLSEKEALIQYYQAMIKRPERTDILKNSPVPVLFVAGTEDAAAPLDDVLQQVQLPKISAIHILKDVGHMSMIEKPAEVNEHLLRFIKFV